MKYKEISNINKSVSRLGLGCSHLGSSLFGPSKADSPSDLLDAAYSGGITFYDTAPTYCYGESEKNIGKYFQGNKRQEVVICTKTGMLLSGYAHLIRPFRKYLFPLKEFISPLKTSLKKKSSRRFDFRPEHIEESLNQSLKRLHSDYVDIFLLHSPPVTSLTNDAIFEKLETLKQSGRILAYGVSPLHAEEAVPVMNKYQHFVYQVPFNLLDQAARNEVFPLSVKTDSNLIARVPFGRGMLTKYGKYKTGVQTVSRIEFEKLNHKRNKVEEFLLKWDRSWSELCIQFSWSFKEILTVIPGTTSVKHVLENIQSTNSQPLNAEEIKDLAGILSNEIEKQ